MNVSSFQSEYLDVQWSYDAASTQFFIFNTAQVPASSSSAHNATGGANGSVMSGKREIGGIVTKSVAAASSGSATKSVPAASSGSATKSVPGVSGGSATKTVLGASRISTRRPKSTAAEIKEQVAEMSALKCGQLKANRKSHKQLHALSKMALHEQMQHAKVEHELKVRLLQEEHEAKMELMKISMSIKRAKLALLKSNNSEG